MHAIVLLLLCFFMSGARSELVLTPTTPTPSASPVDFTCMITHCGVQSLSCFTDQTCLNALSCSSACMQHWNDDPTPGKVHAQNCTTKCAITYLDNRTQTYMSCMMSNHCINFPPINITCPVRTRGSHRAQRIPCKPYGGMVAALGQERVVGLLPLSAHPQHVQFELHGVGVHLLV